MTTKNLKCLAALCALTLSLTAVRAQAEIIGGVSYIQPTSATATTGTWSEGPYNGGVAALIDGSGVDTVTGYANSTDPVGGVLSPDGFSTYVGSFGHMIFDLGAEYTLTGSQIWSRSIDGRGNEGTRFAAGGGGDGTGPKWLFNGATSGTGGLRNFTISTSLSSATSGNAFATPIDSLVVTNLPDPADSTTPTPNYAGTNIVLAATSPARYVMFSYNQSTAPIGWYTDRNARESFGLNEVRFQTASTGGGAIPEPSTLALAGIGLLGLLACGRRRRRA